MIERAILNNITNKLDRLPVVAILGCRQVGKTTLALRIAKEFNKPSIYLDLQRPSNMAMLEQAELFLQKQHGKLVILDEIHIFPDIFPILRSLIDERRQNNEKTGQFLILGSASIDLLKQSSESLAGRIAYIELDPLNIEEVRHSGITDYADQLWVRGGFPDSYLCNTDGESNEWRENFIRTYLRRDLPELGANLPAELVYRLWRMISYDQGCQINMSKLASNLSISATTAKNYIDILTDLFLVRQLKPWSGNSKKRLVKTPKIYVRDSGLLHSMVGIQNYNDLCAHPLYGQSWEGFIIEQILQIMPERVVASFYRTNAGAEIDLVLETPDNKVCAIEIKRTSNPTISKGFRLGCEDIAPDYRLYVTPTTVQYPLDEKTDALNIEQLLEFLRSKVF